MKYNIYFFLLWTINLQALPIAITSGGTSRSSLTAYAVITGGIDSVSALQQVSGTGSLFQLLTSNGAGVLPSWQADANSSGTSGLQFIKTYIASNSASLAFNRDDLLLTYKTFMIILNNLQPTGTSVNLYAYWSTDNGASYLTTGYSSGINYVTYNSSTVNNINNNTSILLSTANSLYVSGILYLYGANGALSSGPALTGCVASDYPCNYGNIITIISGNPTINNMKFQFSSGNIASGSISLYGLV